MPVEEATVASELHCGGWDALRPSCWLVKNCWTGALKDLAMRPEAHCAPGRCSRSKSKGVLLCPQVCARQG